MTAIQPAWHPEHVGILAIEAVWPATYVRLDPFLDMSDRGDAYRRCLKPPSMLLLELMSQAVGLRRLINGSSSNMTVSQQANTRSVWARYCCHVKPLKECIRSGVSAERRPRCC